MLVSVYYFSLIPPNFGSPGLLLFDFLHKHGRALFDLHQTPNQDSEDRKLHCASPFEYGFQQCHVPM
jgi:hypothetical protein